MALVVCPECKKEISEYTELCPACGFPLKKFIEENKFLNISGVLICPRCAEIYDGWNIKYGLPQNLKCEYCNTILVQTNENTEEIYKLSANLSDDDFNDLCIELAIKYGNNKYNSKANQFMLKKRHQEVEKSIQEADDYFERKSTTENRPKCPKCGSTQIQLINRKFTILTGFATNKVDRVCVNCKHRW